MPYIVGGGVMIIFALSLRLLVRSRPELLDDPMALSRYRLGTPLMIVLGACMAVYGMVTLVAS